MTNIIPNLKPNIISIVGTFGPFDLFIMLVAVILPIIALIDIIKRDFKGNNKIGWIFVVCFFTILGAILYFIIGKNQKISQ